MQQDQLSPRDLAAALGVSESSLKRWIDQGRIRARRTEGGHRRIALADALSFVRRSGTPIVRPEVLGLSAAEPAMGDRPAPAGVADLPHRGDAALYRALTTGDGPAVHAWIARRAETADALAELCDGPIRRAMAAIGELWLHDPDGVVLEHRATDLCVQALSVLRARLEPLRGPRALGGGPEDDPYVLPSTMAAAVLAAGGFRTINLGPDTPTAAFHRAVDREQPLVVWVSASAPVPLALAHELASFVRTNEATAIVGGRHRAAIAAADPGVRVATTMAELLAFGRTLH